MERESLIFFFGVLFLQEVIRLAEWSADTLRPNLEAHQMSWEGATNRKYWLRRELKTVRSELTTTFCSFRLVTVRYRVRINSVMCKDDKRLLVSKSTDQNKCAFYRGKTGQEHASGKIIWTTSKTSHTFRCNYTHIIHFKHTKPLLAQSKWWLKMFTNHRTLHTYFRSFQIRPLRLAMWTQARITFENAASAWDFQLHVAITSANVKGLFFSLPCSKFNRLADKLAKWREGKKPCLLKELTNKCLRSIWLIVMNVWRMIGGIYSKKISCCSSCLRWKKIQRLYLFHKL